MRIDQPQPWRARDLLFLVPIILFALIYGTLRYDMWYHPQRLSVDVKVCTDGYKKSRTAADTSVVDKWIPPERHYLRLSMVRPCKYFREGGATK